MNKVIQFFKLGECKIKESFYIKKWKDSYMKEE